MKENLRAILVALTIPILICVAIIVLSPYAQRQMESDKESDTIYKQRTQLERAFRSVYQKLAAQHSDTGSSEAALIRAVDVRKSLSDDFDTVAELPEWVAADRTFVRTNDVSTGSGKMLCFVEIGRGHVPFGLDANGVCRYATIEEARSSEFLRLPQQRRGR